MMKMTPVAVAFAIIFGASEPALAADSPEVQTLKQQMEAMQKQMAAMQNRLEAMAATPQPPQKTAASDFPLTTQIGGANVSLYGFVDLSADVGNDGKQGVKQVSSNLSYVGVRGSKDLGSTGMKAIFQVETLANISGTPTETGALASRNSFVGLEGGFGKLMLGKTDTPYKRATAMMDPFASSVGDYNTIMGNTGGDLRAEFDARLPHAIFYDSPKLRGFLSMRFFRRARNSITWQTPTNMLLLKVKKSALAPRPAAQVRCRIRDQHCAMTARLKTPTVLRSITSLAPCWAPSVTSDISWWTAPLTMAAIRPMKVRRKSASLTTSAATVSLASTRNFIVTAASTRPSTNGPELVII
ncbi:porin [Undibacterium arcticum]|uniref:porin n=1 Tax=Undibacterium arcticum TaxID=1762892 RepID=UPI00360D27E9